MGFTFVYMTKQVLMVHCLTLCNARNALTQDTWIASSDKTGTSWKYRWQEHWP